MIFLFNIQLDFYILNMWLQILLDFEMQTESALAESNEDALQTDGSAENYLSQIIDQVDILLLKIALLKPKDKEIITNFWGFFFCYLGCRYPNSPKEGDQICWVSTFYAKTPEKITFHSDKVEDLWKRYVDY